MSINTPLIVCLSLALLLVVIALAREMRLRRALQLLLARLLRMWRSSFDRRQSARPDGSRSADPPDNAPSDDRPP
jgi:hypothetical protein